MCLILPGWRIVVIYTPARVKILKTVAGVLIVFSLVILLLVSTIVTA